MAMVRDNPFGMPLHSYTIVDLHDLGITDWAALAALGDRDRKLLFGWGPVTERRFRELRATGGP